MSAQAHGTRSTDGRADQALYVYCFARPGAVGPLSVPGVSGATDVRTLDLGAVAAVVSPLRVDEFLGEDGEDHSQDLAWVAPRAVRHEAVVEEAMRTSPVLPVSFGAVFSSPRALEEAVGSHRQRITDFLEDVADKQEWAVKVFVHRLRLREHLQHAPDFLRQQEQPPASPGARYFHQKRLQRELDGRLQDEARRRADSVLAELSPLALAVHPLRLAEREVTGRPDDMLAHVALLVPVDRVEGLLRRVGQLAEQLQPQGLTVEASGPWPPYSFCPRLEVPS